MEDIFGRELEVGDTIIYVWSDRKWLKEVKVKGFGNQFGKPYAQSGNGRVQSEFIIIKKHSGEGFIWKETN